MFLSVSFLLLFAVNGLHGYCSSRTLYATTSTYYISYLSYSNNQDCSYTIRPASLYSSGYYLEIKWIRFQVEGNMPSCKDYIEVKLTRSSVSIGKFCSDNIGSSSLFNMYSSDGYAVIRFKSDSSITRGGFRLTYQLKSRSSGYLGSYSRNDCGHIPALIQRSGVLYSNGWPRGYAGAVGGFCYLRLDVGSTSATKIVVMDINLRSLSSLTCSSSNDYLDVKQSSFLYTTSSSIKTYPITISGKLCRTLSPRSYTATSRYVYIYFNRPLGSLLSRGFMVGYIAYTKTSPTSTTRRRVVITTRRRVLDTTRRRVYRRRISTTRLKSKRIGIITGASVGSLVVIGIIIVVAAQYIPACQPLADCFLCIFSCLTNCC